MFKCDTCNKDFAHKKNLKRHVQSIHNLSMKMDSKCRAKNKEAKHTCPVCQLVFVERSSLRRHERIKHNMNITESLKKKNMKSQCVIFEHSNLEDYPSLKKLVPEDYVYQVNSIEDLENNHIQAKFEIADCDEKMFLVWLSKLEQKSEVTYRVKSFTKSSSPKIVFNKVYRCIHNTYPNKFCIPHPKHTGCPATLTVRIKKCSEALSVKNAMADNSIILIPLKAIVTLNHFHNHIILGDYLVEYSTTKKNVYNKTQNYESFENVDEFSNSSSSFSLEIPVTVNDNCQKNNIEIVEEVILNDCGNKKCVTDDNILKMNIDDDKLELSEEFDDYILVENVNTDNSFYNNDNENKLYQLLLDYDTVNERMMQQFQSNPNYFMSAIKTYILAMKNKLTSKESLSTALSSFGKNLQK